jgi:hypothetical protein
MVRIAEPNFFGDAWLCSFEGKTTIEPSNTLRVFGGVFVEQSCEQSCEKLQRWRPVDRISLWLSSIESVGGDASPPPIEWELRARGSSSSHRLALVSMAAPSWEHRGLIVQVSGVLCIGFDVFARVTTKNAKPVRVNVAAILDRVGGPFSLIIGENVSVLP